MVRGQLSRAEARANSAEERAAVAHADLLEAKAEMRGMQGQVREEGGRGRGGSRGQGNKRVIG